MQNKKLAFKINKLYLPAEAKKISKPPNFQRFGNLYLELLENTEKIKQSLVGKEYIPNNNKINIPNLPQHHIPQQQKQLLQNDIPFVPQQQKVELIESSLEESNAKHNVSSENDKRDNKKDNRDEKRNKRDSSSGSNSDSDSDSDSDNSASSSSADNNITNREDDEISKRLKKLIDDDDDDNRNSNKSSSAENNNEIENKLLRSVHSSSSSLSQPLLSKGEVGYSLQPPKERSQEHFDNLPSRHSTPYKTQIPPTLNELRNSNFLNIKPDIRHVDRLGMDEKEILDKKRELLFKFDLLKKGNPNLEISHFTIHSDYTEMSDEYETKIRHITIDNNMNYYKKWLIAGFIGSEYVFGKLGLDMQGFAQNQFININSYDRLLIELGEKAYVPGGSQYPVEVRLMGMIVMNACTFVMGKMFMKGTNTNLFSALNVQVNNQNNNDENTRKPKMKGPNIEL